MMSFRMQAAVPYGKTSNYHTESKVGEFANQLNLQKLDARKDKVIIHYQKLFECIKIQHFQNLKIKMQQKVMVVYRPITKKQ